MTKQDIIEYVMNTPHNTNKAVLNSMLNQLDDSDDGDSWTVLTEESVTTRSSMIGTMVGILSYSQEISADTIRITFDGTEYECEKVVAGDSDTENIEYVYGATYNESAGAIDWSEYPFTVTSIPYPDNSGAENALITETAGTYTIKIEVPQSSGSSDFSTAEVTVINNRENYFETECPYVDPSSDEFFGRLGCEAQYRYTYNVVLYKGTGKMAVLGNATVTGDIEIATTPFGPGDAIITGNGTITLS